ncbi:hypothetical protein PF005_g32049 [Phytophthora fragariae]|uniref:Uncharacterized protein n=2 Tax=Phytophthora fragariae TaxID=53985 RepID=A0A6A3PQG3_9STRA|nr:hypothetical protein PF011_g31435 [Phytophthora fragariae]KAE9056614.1 hypothetical protein PF010_g31700 [Phytophthora fragariae]KAE9059329.1 hypothetical protein PF006_g31915 [Phytophthora fragariae]KAE9066363.1 hypothetical protein PF007_g28504 [Phytophthora fragariae]KAE9159416.1 hypothetical protein PF005_g32049 [Phytophthora fragariae]
MELELPVPKLGVLLHAIRRLEFVQCKDSLQQYRFHLRQITGKHAWTRLSTGVWGSMLDSRGWKEKM